MKNEERGFTLSQANAETRPRAATQREETPRATWHRPQLERLRVSVDTAFTKGSGIDGGFATLG